MLVLTDSEASLLMDACALLVLATQSNAGAALTPGMATLLCGVFSGLKMQNSPTSI
jgi:hypothetical protein